MAFLTHGLLESLKKMATRKISSLQALVGQFQKFYYHGLVTFDKASIKKKKKETRKLGISKRTSLRALTSGQTVLMFGIRTVCIK